MKQLILTFFAVILCYSLFFDTKKTKEPEVDKINYIHEDALMPELDLITPDTLTHYTLYNADMIRCFSAPEEDGITLLK